ncbi:MAG: hypothetical protein ACREMN_07665 [Gemmatimonadales bacterium]
MLALPAAATGAQQPDSATVLRRARDAQSRFEFTRRQNLPFGGSGSHPCDAYIGRFCYWHEPPDDRPPAPPPEEPEAIRRARARLLAALDSVAAVLPGDAWIAGQRVRYLLEADRGADAIAAAGACRAASWWCAALAGLALHVSGDYTAAESAFTRSLGDMPAEQRCRWTDISLLLEEDLGRRYERADCDARIAMAERIWWLAQPLYSLPANDRRTEHFARRTMARIGEDGRSPYAVRWRDDLTELTLRYGWPTHWTRTQVPPGSMREPTITGHGPEPGFHFFPESADSHPAWDLEAVRPRERHAPAYATAFVALPHQVGVFRRGDSCLVVAAFDVGADTGFTRVPPHAALVVTQDERHPPVIARSDSAATTGRFVATSSCASQLVSLELVARDARRAARARLAYSSPVAVDNLAISDILLFRPPPSLPEQLDGVLPHLHGSASLRRPGSLGLYWEVYGVAAHETLNLSVTVTPERAGWLRRATTALGLTQRRAATHIEWQELAEVEDGRAARSLVLDLRGLPSGSYRIEVAALGRGRAVARRDITIER